MESPIARQVTQVKRIGRAGRSMVDVFRCNGLSEEEVSKAVSQFIKQEKDARQKVARPSAATLNRA